MGGEFVERFDGRYNALPVYRLSLNDCIDPYDAQSMKFKDLKANDDAENPYTDREALQDFASAMSAFGLDHVWSAVRANNAQNCLEANQGMPILRLARYGFMSQPQPGDLAGLLNANGLYSFATGIAQLVASILMI